MSFRDPGGKNLAHSGTLLEIRPGGRSLGHLECTLESDNRPYVSSISFSSSLVSSFALSYNPAMMRYLSAKGPGLTSHRAESLKVWPQWSFSRDKPQS